MTYTFDDFEPFQLRADSLGDAPRKNVPGQGDSEPLGRNNALARAAIAMHRAGGEPEQIAQGVRVLNGAFHEPLPEREVSNLLRGKVRYRPAEAPAQRRPLRVLRWGEIEIPTRSAYFVKNTIGRGEFGEVFGAWGSSKSFISLDIAAHVAAGRSWMGHRVQSAPVFYVCAEGAGGFMKRAAAVKQEQFPGEIPLFVVPQPVALLDDSHVDALAETMREHAPDVGLVFFDTWAASISGANEEKTSEIQPAIDACARLRGEFDGLTTIIVHHTGHTNQERSRGAYGLECALDFQLRVSASGDVYTIEGRKSKDTTPMPPAAYRLRVVELGVDQDGDPIDTCVVEPTDESPAEARVKKTTRSKAGLLLARVMEEHMGRLGLHAPDDLRGQLAEAQLSASPAGQLVLRIDDLREPFYARSRQEADTKRDTWRTAFRRGREDLQAAGIVEVWGKFIWFA